MKIKKIEHTEVTKEDIAEYTKRISALKGKYFNASDVGIDKRIITIRLDEVSNELTLVNPVIESRENEAIVYFEEDDTKPKKLRRTIRFPSIVVDTDNLGRVEFKSTNENWDSLEELLSDEGLYECVLVQRLIDSIGGISNSSPQRRYNQPLTLLQKNEIGDVTRVSQPKKMGRNERIMMQNEGGDTIFVKYKKADVYQQKGYKII